MSLDAIAGALAGKVALVTGASGFIGGRVAERLVLEHGVEVRAMVRTLSSAGRLVRFPVTVLQGDVTDPEALAAACRGVDLVFHCAFGTQGSQKHRAWVNQEGTRRLLAAAGRARVSRIVHLSTLMVYGRTADGDLDESAPRRRFGNAYSDSKLAAERIATGSGLPVAVLQPTAVYGPFGGIWTANVLAALKRGRQILVNGGDGLGNAVYVDDLVSAMLLAAVKDEAVGESFLVSGAEPVTWKVLFERFARMLGEEPRTVAMSEAEALAYYRLWKRRQPRLLGEGLRAVKGDEALRDRLLATREMVLLRELASTLLPERTQQRIKERLFRGGGPPPPAVADEEAPIHPLRPEMIDFFRAKTRVRIDKARRLLGYEPAWGFAEGMERTEQWARWASLL